MSIDRTIKIWESRKRRMGCVLATDWFCKRVEGFKPEVLIKYTEDGYRCDHTVATNGKIRIDLAPYADKPEHIKKRRKT